MTSQPHQKLAHYQVLESIGKGGMGEVYRARDSRLGRDVAIKVLPDEFARDEERLRRFQREAKVLASLNHPNIAAIHGLEQQGELHYLVLELVPGQTLAERIARGPIPVDEALEIAKKIAEALEEAHEQGIVHRDLKPANVKLTPDDKVKVLDFGLAKAFAEEGAEADAANSMSPTITRDATRIGVILGTAAYMSPEQAKGKRVDKRTDIFAFGVVLYEMLAGKKAFVGGDVAEVLASVIKSEPDWSSLPSLPPSIDALLKRCFEKDPKRRLRDIGEARLAIERSVEGELEVPPSRRSRSAIWAAPLLGAGVVLGAVAVPRGKTVGDENGRQVVRFDIDVPGNANGHLQSTLAMTERDEIIFSRTVGSTQQLYRRSPRDKELVPIAGTEGGILPFLSPDGAWLGFHADGELKKVRLEGGIASSICPVSRAFGASWGDDDRIVFANEEGLWRVGSAGGTPELLIAGELTDDDPTVFSSPDVLPGAQAVVLAKRRGAETLVSVLSLETGETRELLAGVHPRYAPTGHLVFVRDSTLWAAPFDLDEQELAGEPVPLVEGVHMHGNYDGSQFALSPTGSLAYSGGRSSTLVSRLVSVDRSGSVTELPYEPADYAAPRISPDGRYLAMTVGTTEYDIWLFDRSRPARTRLTFVLSGDSPVWSPDGERIAFCSRLAGVDALFWISANGTGEAERLLPGRSNLRPSSFSPDGRTLLYIETVSSANQDIWALTIGEEPSSLVATAFNERMPRFSPDGRWIAYVSDQSGRDEVYVRSYRGAAGEIPVSTDGGADPVWSAKGDELFFTNGSRMMVVPIQRVPDLDFGEPRVLFEAAFRSQNSNGSYDVTPDGQRFIMIPETAEGSTAQIQVVLDWADELEELVPAEE